MSLDFSPVLDAVNFDVVAVALLAIFAGLALVVVCCRGGEILLRSIGADSASIASRKASGYDAP